MSSVKTSEWHYFFVSILEKSKIPDSTTDFSDFQKKSKSMYSRFLEFKMHFELHNLKSGPRAGVTLQSAFDWSKPNQTA